MAKRRVPPPDPATRPGPAASPGDDPRPVGSRSGDSWHVDGPGQGGDPGRAGRQADGPGRAGRQADGRGRAGRQADGPGRAGRQADGARGAGDGRSVVVRVRPGAGRTRVGGRYEGPHGPALIVAVGAPAVDGKATEAVRRVLAAALGVKVREVVLKAGATSRDKVFTVGADVGDRVAALRDGST